ncbi:V-type ATP synthase subunit B [Sedimenticola selenatireducens]|uniref:V-type ATP synthase beta chain n=1 Tax=Sedimenticola selenatireducens TaxID=191960 RepID=A0A558DL16_9GAMM|nr:V-type ATP synthase subunit B [Sedimenticola selenatireducens]TVO70041.1 V-type ATP synthase subunit B [Sedimenticola selenatireducens]TVT61717.1 MAG: V-type ATP synthase subunit B [Sedimenticola selenatireducens]
MSAKEYRTVSSAQGSLLIVEQAPQVAFGDQVIIRDHLNNKRHGQVIRTSEREALIQVFEGTGDLDLENTWVRFLDQSLEINLSPEILGRIFNGIGTPKDGRPPILSNVRRNVNGSAINPAARTYPREFIQTGISSIDGLNSLVRGQKLPIFSASGLPHNRLAAQIVRQAKLVDEESSFSIVFAAMGVSYADARFFQEEFADSGVLGNVVMYINLADDPPVERLALPRVALTAAEYLAFDLDRHVLVVLTDMTNYAEALREVATAKGDVPSRKGYPGYLYSDLAEIYERSGRIKDRHGSVTMVPVVTMPSDDITHPIPDLTGYITEGQIVLSRELHNQGVYPPVHISPSLSRLMKDGIGKDDTREDHPRVANQLYAMYAKAMETRNLAAIIGAEELSERDRRYLKFAEAFDSQFVGQGEDEDRSIIETLNLAWELLSMFPKDMLTRVQEADLAKYHRSAD